MLTEHFVASISIPNKKPDTSSVVRDAGIFVYEHQPLLAQRHAFKKSAAAVNCVAVSRSHVFAAQVDKAVVHVYNRDKGNQEATVPFPEKISSLALAFDDTMLCLGTDGGRVILWEICTGRLINGPQAHLQPVTALAVDPSSHFLLSASADSNIHVWSLPNLSSFLAPSSPSPVHTLSNHRGAITALAVGHSSSAANIVVSVSKDNTAIVWDYKKNALLATYLLGDTPLALALDSADRGFFATYEDGSLQYIDFYAQADNEPTLGATDSLRDPETSYTPITPPSSSRRPSDQGLGLGAGLSITLSWDGTTVLTGHASGKVVKWSASGGQSSQAMASLPGSVTNLSFVAPSGFSADSKEEGFKIHTIVKPRLDLKANISEGEIVSPVPQNYTFSAQLVGNISRPSISALESPRKGQKSAFEEALTHVSFPSDFLEQSLAELATFTNSSSGTSTGAASEPKPVCIEDDYMAIDSGAPAGNQDLEQQNAELKDQIAALQRVQKATFKQLADLKEEKKKWQASSSDAGSGANKDDGEEKRRRKERITRALKGFGDD
ncbi:WD40-repeat-containing domain protein [Phyllosticta citriasiana]|uniref:Pre-rRNA-processing protein IPI3 n=1 Tax=Phyllosticta citriasiana TaxID=595635 RepID=A0ABR1KNT2_9PEZI